MPCAPLVRDRPSVTNVSGQRPRRRPSLALIPPAVPAPPIYEVMGDHGSPPGPLSASLCHVDIVGGCLSISMCQETWAYAVGGFPFYKILIIR